MNDFPTGPHRLRGCTGENHRNGCSYCVIGDNRIFLRYMSGRREYARPWWVTFRVATITSPVYTFPRTFKTREAAEKFADKKRVRELRRYARYLRKLARKNS